MNEVEDLELRCCAYLVILVSVVILIWMAGNL